MPWLQWCRAFATGCSKKSWFFDLQEFMDHVKPMWNPPYLREGTTATWVHESLLCLLCYRWLVSDLLPNVVSNCPKTMDDHHPSGTSPVCWYKCPWISWSWRLTKRKKNKRPSRNPNCSNCINCLLKKWKTLGGLRFEAYNGYFHKLWYSKAFPNLHIPLKSMSFALSRISD